jgi:hypothetical protein
MNSLGPGKGVTVVADCGIDLDVLQMNMCDAYFDAQCDG